MAKNRGWSTPPSMFTKFSDNGSGSLITSGGELAWDSNNAGRELYLFNGGPLQTDLFEVSVVLPQVPTHGWFGADSSNYIWLIGRSNAGSTALVAARLAWDEIRLYNLAGGTFTQFGPTISESDILTAGCSVSYKGGTVAEPRYFHVAINGTKKLVYTDGSAGAHSLDGRQESPSTADAFGIRHSDQCAAPASAPKPL